MSDNVLGTQVFRLKGRLYTMTVLELLDPNVEAFEEALRDVVESAPKLFENTPIVLDLTAFGDIPFSPKEHFSCLRRFGLIPVGVQSDHENFEKLQGIARFKASKAKDKALKAEKKETRSQETLPSRLHTQPVRSGQQLAATQGDLIVMSSVSCGAEVLAKDNIHIYGVLRGRALAGISGNQNARIFCMGLQAELISIAGVYLVSDDIKKQDKPCQIYYQNEKIIIEPLSV